MCRFSTPSNSILCGHQSDVLKFNSFLTLLAFELAQTQEVKDSISQNCHPLQMPITSRGFPSYHTSVHFGYKLGVSWPPAQVQYLAMTASKLREALNLVLPVHYKEHKWTARWRSTRKDLLSSWSLVCSTLLVHGCVHQPGSSLNPLV